MKLSFEILCDLPSGNVRDRTHWSKHQALKDQWWWLIKEACQNAKIKYVGNTSYFKEKVKGSFVVYIKDKRSEKDKANLIHAIDKLILDNLFEQPLKSQYGVKRFRRPAIHLLVNDDPKWFEWGEVKQVIGTPERVKVILEEAGQI